jgi:hypothetical protein
MQAGEVTLNMTDFDINELIRRLCHKPAAVC